MSSKSQALTKQSLLSRLKATLSSKWFFIVCLVIFVAGVLWIIFSSIYPMAYDEAYHFGLINLYSNYWHPFFANQPPNADVYGSVAREPSFLYHYLFGQLFRGIRAVCSTELAQILVLRCLSLAMVVPAILILRSALVRFTRYSLAQIHLALSFFMLVPMVSMLSAQINYDNAMFLLSSVVVYLALKTLRLLESKKVDSATLFWLAITGLITCVTKYTFLPAFFGLVIFLVWSIWRTMGITPAVSSFRKSFSKLSTLYKLGVIALFIIAAGLSWQRYGINVLRYGRPVPDCRQVLTEHQCWQYPPWQRNYVFIYYKDANLNTSIYPFTRFWLSRLYRSLLYVLNGPASQYSVGAPFAVPLIVARLFLITGFFLGVFLALFKRQRFKQEDGLFLCIIVCFVAILFLQNYTDFVRVGQRIAVQGRYLLPIVLPMILLLISIFNYALQGLRGLKIGLAVFALLIATQGLGVTAFILRSDQEWYRESQRVIDANHKARSIIAPLVIEN